jgi:hypothetical protein
MTLDSALELPSLSTIDPPTDANDQIITNPRYKTQGMSMKQVYSLYRAQFPGPASFPNNGAGCGTKNNGVFEGRGPDAKMGMPQKFNPSADDNLFSSGRRSFIQNAYKNYNRSLWARSLEGPINKTGMPLNRNTGDDVVRMRKIKAMGSSTKVGPVDNQLAFKNFNRNTSRDAARRCRSGGCVAPAKKGANVNFKSGGRWC